jgi:hypothetical protein
VLLHCHASKITTPENLILLPQKMKSPIPLLAIFLSFSCFSLAASAETPPSATNIALASQLVDLMHLDKAMNVGLNNMKQMQSKMLDSSTTNSSTDIKERVQKSMEVGMSAATAFMTPEKLHAMYVSVYASTFTAEELQGAITFYQSPVGQTWIEKQPQLSAAIMEKTMEMMPKMSQMMDSINKSMGALDALRKNTNLIPSNLLPPATPASTPTN